MISEHPTGKHVEYPGGDFDCDPKTGTFYVTWEQDEETKAIFMFSSQTLTRWLELPGWKYKDEWGNVSEMHRKGHNFQIGDSEWNFDFWLTDIVLHSKFRDHAKIPAFRWEKGNGRNTGWKHSWFDWWTFSWKTIEIYLE
jgi:hypothetical protein